MTQVYDNTNSGALFKNDRKETEKHPDYTGSLNVGGQDHWISALIKTSKDGTKKFMSLSVKKKDGKLASAKPDSGARPSLKDDLEDSDIPF